jgi:hypothetical protein
MRSLSVLLFFTGLALPGAALADALEDFEAASKKSGCNSIPYGKLRGACKGLSGKVNSTCKVKRMTCTDLGTRALRDTIKNLEKAVAQNKRSSLRKGSKKRKTGAKQLKLVRTKKRALKRQISQIDANMGQIRQCVGSRKAVNSLFKRVERELKAERDRELKRPIRKILKQFKTAKRGHDDAIDDYEKALKYCKEARSGRK